MSLQDEITQLISIIEKLKERRKFFDAGMLRENEFLDMKVIYLEIKSLEAQVDSLRKAFRDNKGPGASFKKIV